MIQFEIQFKARQIFINIPHEVSLVGNFQGLWTIWGFLARALHNLGRQDRTDSP